MTVELVVSALPGELRAAVVEGDVLADLLVLRDDAEGGEAVQAGDLFLARVQRFDKGLDGAFVDLGLERPGLLPRKEMPDGKPPPEGTAVAVKVIRAPAEDKGARVSARGVEADTAGLKAPARLAGAAGPLQAFLAALRPERVVTDAADLLPSLRSAFPGADFTLHADARPLFESEGLEAEVEALLAPRVELPSGGFLLIEPGQTLTAIDVNAGRSEGRGGPAAQAKAVNLAAVPTIVRQLRLRALSGLIVVDFLALRVPEERKAVTAALRAAVADDPETCQVFGMSPSGLLEMTRRRGRLPLHELLCRPCGFAGSGREKTPVTLAYEALRQIVAVALGMPVASLTVKAAPDVAAALAGPQAAALAAVERRLGRSVTVVADPLEAGYALVLG